MTDTKKRGVTPKYSLKDLLIKTVEGRKATTDDRAYALAAAFHAYCFQNQLDAASISQRAYTAVGLVELGKLDPVAEVLPPTPVETTVPILANAPKYFPHIDEEG